MSDDAQDQAETFDEEMVGEDPVTSDELGGPGAEDWPPQRAHGIQFADADVSDESVADRSRQEEPEVWERDDVAEAEVGGLRIDDEDVDTD